MPQVHLTMSFLNMSCSGALAEDEARALAQALLDGIEQSSALSAREAG
jgi:hypothetical protein